MEFRCFEFMRHKAVKKIISLNKVACYKFLSLNILTTFSASGKRLTILEALASIYVYSNLIYVYEELVYLKLFATLE